MMIYKQESQVSSLQSNREGRFANLHRCIVGMQYQRNGSKQIGTGFLIASNLILTAAHILYNKKQQKPNQNLCFYPGEASNIGEGYKVKSWRYRKQFLEQDKSQLYDYALLKLQDRICHKEYIQLGVNYQQNDLQAQVDKNFIQWPNLPNEDNKYGIMFSPYSTYAGSPIIVKRNNKEIAIALHCGSSKNGKNRGRVITEEVCRDLIQWEKQLSSQIKFVRINKKTEEIQQKQIELSCAQKNIKIPRYQQVLQIPQQQNNLFFNKCKKHDKYGYYFTQQHNIIFCNKCVELQNQLKKKIILCKKHNKTIMYKQKHRKISTIEDSSQIYLCSQCLNTKSPLYYEDISMILDCHFEQIKQICTDQLCIKNNTFLICPKCININHENHHKILFQRQSILYHYNLINQQNVMLNILFENNNQTRKKDMITKLNQIIDKQNSMITQFKSYLQLFTLKNNSEMEQMINFLLLNGQSKSMSALWILRQINNKLKDKNNQQIYNHINNIQVLLIDTMQKYLKISFKQINSIFQSFFLKISTILTQNIEEISQKIKQEDRNQIMIVKNYEDQNPKNEIQQNQRIKFQYQLQKAISNKSLEYTKNIAINYRPNYQGSQKYSIDTFQLFKVVTSCKNLKNVFVKGVFIQNFQQLIKVYMANKDKYILKYTKDQKQLVKYIEWKQIDIICYTQYQQSKWIVLNKLDLQDLSININASITIKHHSHSSKTSHKLRNIKQFLSLFRQVSGIRFIIDLQDVPYLKDIIINLISMVKKVNLQIICRQPITILTDYNEFYILLKLLKDLKNTQIIGIKFKNFKFQTKNKKKLLEIQSYLNQIIKKNVPYLKQVKLQKCMKFPSFSVAQIPFFDINQSTWFQGLKAGQQNQKSILPYSPKKLPKKIVKFTNKIKMNKHFSKTVVLLKQIMLKCNTLITVSLPNSQLFYDSFQQINKFLTKCLREIQQIPNRQQKQLFWQKKKNHKNVLEQDKDFNNRLKAVLNKVILHQSVFTLSPFLQQPQKKEQQIEYSIQFFSNQNIFQPQPLKLLSQDREHIQQYLHTQDSQHIQLHSQDREHIQLQLQSYISQKCLENIKLQASPPSNPIQQQSNQLMTKSKLKVCQQLKNQKIEVIQNKKYKKIKQYPPKFLKQNACVRHSKERRYYCQQKHYDSLQYKYLCNMCVQDEDRNNKHNKDHIIRCKAHNTPIKYKLKLDQEQMDQLLQVDFENLLLCQICLDQYKNKYRQVSVHSFILNCHLKQAQQICIDQNCRRNSNFKVCSVQQCTNHKQHENHQKIPCNKRQFLKYFHFQQHQLQQYIPQFMSSKFKMTPYFFQKIHQEYSILIQQNLLFLQSFILNNQQQVKKWIDRFFQEEQKGSLMILLGAKKLQNNQFKEQQKKRYLDRISDLLEQQLPLRIKQISLVLKNYALDIKKMFEHSYDEIDWNEKYQVIVLNQITSNHQQLLLQQAGPQYRDIVKAIYLKNNFCDDNSKRKKLYQQFYKTTFKEGTKDYKYDDKEEIKNIFFRINYENQYKDNDSPHKQLVLNLIQQKQKIQQRVLQEELYLPLTDMLKGFHNLRVLNINYSKDYYGHFHYQIEASHIFKIIYQNKDIQKIVLTGIKITGLSLFIKHLRLIQKYLIDSHYKLLVKCLGGVETYLLCYQEDGQRQQVNLTKRKFDLPWMKNFNYSHKLQLSIEADLNFNFYCQSEASQQIRNLQYLLRWNITFANADFRIHLFRNDSIEQTKNLVKIMRKMSKIKVSLIKYILTESQQSDPFYFLIKELSTFTNIISIQMKNIIITEQSIKDSNLSDLFDNICLNNQINHFKSTNCILPIIMPLKDLTSIEIRGCKLNKQFKNLFGSNKKLSIIKFSDNIILGKQSNPSQTPLSKAQDNFGVQLDKNTFLQTLLIQNKFIDLSNANLKNLKYLKIVINNKPQQFNLSEILIKLQQIHELCIIYDRKPQKIIKCNSFYESNGPLLSIPSNQLERIHIENWNRVNNSDIIVALKRWDLKYLILRSCLGISKQLLQQIQILRLEQLKVDLQFYQSNERKIEYLKRKGVKISFYQ